jgi:hypothetical protein
MPKISRTIHIIVAALCVVGLAVGVAAVTGPSTAPANAGASHVRTKMVVRRRTVPIGIEGFNQAWAAMTGVWYAGAQQHEAQIAAAAKAARDSAARATTSSTRTTTSGHDASQFDDAAFDRVAQCETGGDWSHQSAFDGGLGIAHGNWDDLRTGNGYAKFGFGPWPQLPAYGSQASREVQIAAARRFIVRYGIGGWGCKAHFYG